MLQKRPVLDIPITTIELLLDIAALGTVIFMLLFLKINYTLLPAEIPTHFDFSGAPDGWGSKNSLLILAGVMIVFYVGLKIMERFPHTYNYLQPINENNAPYQYLQGRMLMAFMKTECVLLFAYLIWGSIETAKGNITGLSHWLLPVFLLVMAVTLVYFIMKMTKKTDKKE
ncbi:MAG TPA: DUF1648 domain-containing protein [Syntrophomonadaceae bacterium]|jgi:uncharacterized membrane protein|nr:DUF1648 domain-containing protein [Syntrophomonadaceae bacterium]